MKILQVSPFDPSARGGVNEHVFRLDHQYREMGHSTRILAPASAGEGEQDDGHVYRLGTAIPIPSNGSTARVTLSPFIITKVKSFLDREHFDVVHMHEPLAPMLPLACLFYSRAVNVGTFHAARRFNFWYHYTKIVLDLFVDRLDVRIAVSETAREFVDNHFPGEYHIIPNGIDLDRFHPSVTPVTEYLDGRKNILFVGRYDESRKGFTYLLKALPFIRKQFPGARLLVVGRGNVERQLRTLREQEIEDVVFLGAVRDQDLPRYYATCDVFVAPSTGRESFGIILLEALACGAPVVASNIPGYAGVIQHGRTGLLIEPKDAHELSLAVVRALADGELRSELVRNGLDHVRQFSWERIAEQLIGVYHQALATHVPSGAPSGLPEILMGRSNG